MTEQRTLTIRACDQHGDIRQDLTQQAEAERPEVVAYADPIAFATFKKRGHEGGVAGREWMWAEPSAGLVAMSRTDECECIVGELRADRDSWAKRWDEAVRYGARIEEQRDAALVEVERLRQFERICEGLPQDSIDGGWTVQGIRAHSKQLEEQLKAAQAEVEALRAELQSQRERNTELIFKLGSATNGWGRCEKERDAALARVAEYEAQGQHSVPGNAAALVRAEAKKYSLNAAGMLDSGAPEHAQTFAIVQLLSEFDDEEAESHWEAIMAYSDFRTSDALFRAAELLAAAPGTEVPQAWLDVQAERRRQITAEGWTPDHDDLYCAAELPRAAAAYILSGANDEAPAIWPFVAKWWKPRDARANYVRAGALILAEIERLDRAAASQGGPRDA
ncbi:TPA: hypothetical protein ACGJUA_002546 [Pseudomonas aeruginosa]|uniref:hypothetical protein n=1 Tax=Pseudomonas aeruginosa TaxID=287 RepID=UPI0006937061|nr:hypothetical protein [Pseudomonas aeruginosa]